MGQQFGDCVTIESRTLYQRLVTSKGQAAFWKQHYNTPLGKGTVTKYVYKVGKILKEIAAKSD